MPIYAYRCAACGHAQDVLQKLSDPVLTVCPACGASAYAKQLTAAGFQLKGSGWYATDFRDGNKPAAKKDADAAAPPADPVAGDKPASDKPAEKTTEKTADKTAAAAPAAGPAPTPASGH
jgi:putative FmdB family regulatory protein